MTYCPKCGKLCGPDEFGVHLNECTATPEHDSSGEKHYSCKTCGYSPENRSTWCALGCGSDYNEMIEVLAPSPSDEQLKAYATTGQPVFLDPSDFNPKRVTFEEAGKELADEPSELEQVWLASVDGFLWTEHGYAPDGMPDEARARFNAFISRQEAAARAVLAGQIVAAGHNEGCLFCGLKDKIALAQKEYTK